MTEYYNWENINDDCNSIAFDLASECEKDDVIVAINNDLIPATLVANRLDLSVVQVKYGEFSGILYDENKLPMISKPIVSGTGLAPNFPKLIIVVSYFKYELLIKNIVKYYKTVGHVVDVVFIGSKLET